MDMVDSCGQRPLMGIRSKTMRSAFLITAIVLVALAVPLPPAAAQQIHQDTTYGYKLGPPIDWLLSTRDTGSEWIIAKFISEKPTYYNDPEGWTWTFTPKRSLSASSVV